MTDVATYVRDLKAMRAAVNQITAAIERHSEAEDKATLMEDEEAASLAHDAVRWTVRAHRAEVDNPRPLGMPE